jgi:CubicO group peptidase (beta-lactamase class C family)
MQLATRMLAILMIFSTGTVFADLPTSSPQRQGFSKDRLERIDDHMRAAVTNGTMVGGLGMIARNGKVIYSTSWGMADREEERAMETNAIFRIYSMTKPITTVALLMLYEEGRFALNDPVAKYLPELDALKVFDPEGGESFAPKRQPTIRDLMRHTAGFTYGIFGDTEVDRLYREIDFLQQKTIADAVRKLEGIPLLYEPGSVWHYSIAVDIQGRLVEVISGLRFGTFLEQRIFEPLAMEDTAFIVPDNNRDRLATLYAPEDAVSGSNTVWQRSTSKILVPAPQEWDRTSSQDQQLESGGGGLVSTAGDYVRFSQMLLNGGELEGQRLLSPKTVALMTADHLGGIPMNRAQDTSGMGFGLGVAIDLDPAASGKLGTAGTYGWGGAAGTRFWVDPAEKLVILFMVQSLPHQTRLGDEFRLLTYQALEASYVP